MPNKREKKSPPLSGITMHPQVEMYRRPLNLSYEDIANRMGATKQYLSQLVRQTNPGIDKLFWVADALGISVAQLWPDSRLCEGRVVAATPVSKPLYSGLINAHPGQTLALAEPGGGYGGNHRQLTSFLSNQVRFSQDDQITGAVPFFEDIYAYGGNAFQFFEGNMNPSGFLILPNIEHCDFSCRVTGDSMDELIQERSIVVGRELHDHRLVHYGNIYVVMTPDELLVKYIRRNKEDPSMIRLVSHNKNFDDLDRRIDEVKRMFEVKVVINYRYGN